MFYNILTEKPRIDISDVPDATELTVGVAPVGKYPINYNDSSIEFKIGADLATKMYDRPQYISPEEGYSQVYAGLNLKGTDEELIEDHAQRIYTQLFASVEISPSYLKDAALETGVFFDRRFIPRYSVENEKLTYDYEPQQTSHYRIRLSYDVTNRISIINDFYHYFDGSFDNEANNDDRRYRNILRFSTSLH